MKEAKEKDNSAEEELRITKLHWAIDFQPRNYGFYPAEERRFNEWVEAQQGKPWQ